MKKKLGAVSVCGAKYRVFQGDFSDRGELETCHGLCDPSNYEIWLHTGMPATKLSLTLVHETLHAIIGASGAIQSTAAALGVKTGDERLEEWEEMFVRVLTPHVFAAFGTPFLDSNGTR
jgi:hypothetical protein